MKTKIKLTYRQDTVREQEVELPIYRKFRTCAGEIYTRINKDLSAIHIGIDIDIGTGKNVYEIEFEREYRFDGSDPEYHLGLGMYALSKEAFEAILNEVKEEINSI